MATSVSPEDPSKWSILDLKDFLKRIPVKFIYWFLTFQIGLITGTYFIAKKYFITTTATQVNHNGSPQKNYNGYYYEVGNENGEPKQITINNFTLINRVTFFVIAGNHSLSRSYAVECSIVDVFYLNPGDSSAAKEKVKIGTYVAEWRFNETKNGDNFLLMEGEPKHRYSLNTLFANCNAVNIPKNEIDYLISNVEKKYKTGIMKVYIVGEGEITRDIWFNNKPLNTEPSDKAFYRNDQWK